MSSNGSNVDLIQQGVEFLQQSINSKNTSNLSEQLKYLEKKGLSNQQINSVLQQVLVTTNISSNIEAASTTSNNSTLNWIMNTIIPGVVVLGVGGLAYYISSIDPSSTMPNIEESSEGQDDINEHNIQNNSNSNSNVNQHDSNNEQSDPSSSSSLSTTTGNGSTLDLDSVLLALLQQSSDMRLVLDTISPPNTSNIANTTNTSNTTVGCKNIPEWAGPLVNSVGNLESNIKAIMSSMNIEPVSVSVVNCISKDTSDTADTVDTVDTRVDLEPILEIRESQLLDAYTGFINSNASNISNITQIEQKLSHSNIVMACNTLKMYFNKLLEINPEQKQTNLSRFKKIVTSNNIFVKNIGKIVKNYENILYFTGYMANYKGNKTNTSNSNNSNNSASVAVQVQSYEYIWGSDVGNYKNSIHCHVDTHTHNDNDNNTGKNNNTGSVTATESVTESIPVSDMKALLLSNKFPPTKEDSQNLLRSSILLLDYIASCCNSNSNSNSKTGTSTNTTDGGGDTSTATGTDVRESLLMKQCKLKIEAMLCKNNNSNSSDNNNNNSSSSSSNNSKSGSSSDSNCTSSTIVSVPILSTDTTVTTDTTNINSSIEAKSLVQDTVTPILTPILTPIADIAVESVLSFNDVSV